MSERIKAGIVAGLVGGVVMGVMMTMMSVPTPEGGSMPMMGMVAKILGSTSLVVGWIYHLFNSAVIGGLFGFLLGQRAQRSTGAALRLGALYGLVWWVLGGLVLMPLFLGMPALAPLMMSAMRMVALGSLMGHVLFGLILGWAYVGLRARRRGTPATA